MERINAAVYSFERPEHACAYIRMIAPLEAVRSEVAYAWGVSYQQNCLYKRKIIHGGYVDFADLIIVQRIFPQKRTANVLKKIVHSGKPVIYDIDDLFIDLPPDHVDKDFLNEFKPYVMEVMKQVDAITVSTPELAKALASYSDMIHVLPNLVDDALWRGGLRTNSDRIVIGFGGTVTHTADVTSIEEALLAIAEKYRGKIVFKFLGCATPRLASLSCVEYIDFKHSYVEYAQALQGAGVDIALVPLADNPFNRCKSNIKWLEYSACAIPGIYADLAPYNSCVESGKTGLLVGGSTREWIEALEFLIGNPGARCAMGDAARQEVLANYALSTKAHIYADFYRRIVQERRNSSVVGRRHPGMGASFLKLCRRSPFPR